MALHRLHRVDLRRLHPPAGGVPPPGTTTPSSWSWHPTWTTRCSARWAPPPPTDRRRAPPPSRSCTSRPGLARWAGVLSEATGTDLAARAGAGAAGGVGFAALALGAVLRPGIDLVLGLTGFLASQLVGAGLVVTGEGSLDSQTLHGKAPAGVAAAARAAGVPVIAVAGRVLLSRPDLEAAGIAGALALADLEPDPRRSMRDARQLLVRLGKRIALARLDRDRSPLLA